MTAKTPAANAAKPLPSLPKTAVFIHGAYMTPGSWDSFRKPFEEAGITVLAPAWPLMDRPVEALRTSPPAAFGALTVGAIADHYAQIIRSLPEPPLLVGHSFGGLIVQILLDRGLCAAGIAIDPAPIGGVLVGPVSLGAAFPILARWNGWSRPFTLSRKAFETSFANAAPPAVQAAEYERLVVPAPGRIFYQAASFVGTFVSPARRSQPLLLIAGGKDRTVTPFVVKGAYRKQRRSPARTDFKLFPARSHFLIAEPGWEEVAYFALNWARALAPDVRQAA